MNSADAGVRTVTNCSFVAGYENYSIKSYSATATITQKVITEFNTTLTPQTGTSVIISASVDLDNGKQRRLISNLRLQVKVYGIMQES